MYSNLCEQKPKYLTENGTVVKTEVDGVDVPVSLGYKDAVYGEPVPFIANIIPIGSESYARHNTAISSAYGIDISEYEALIILNAGELPIDEKTYVWHGSKPEYKYMNGEGVVDVNSADYKVERVATSKNIMLVMVRRVNHGKEFS